MMFILSSANAFNLDLFKDLSFGNELTHYQTTKFRLAQIGTNFRHLKGRLK